MPRELRGNGVARAWQWHADGVVMLLWAWQCHGLTISWQGLGDGMAMAWRCQKLCSVIGVSVVRRRGAFCISRIKSSRAVVRAFSRSHALQMLRRGVVAHSHHHQRRTWLFTGVATTWECHRSAIAITLQLHGNGMTTTWSCPCNGVAPSRQMRWQRHGNDMDMTWARHVKGVANEMSMTWQGHRHVLAMASQGRGNSIAMT